MEIKPYSNLNARLRVVLKWLSFNISVPHSKSEFTKLLLAGDGYEMLDLKIRTFVIACKFLWGRVFANMGEGIAVFGATRGFYQRGRDQ